MADSDLAGYFDYNATTPLCESARRAWLENSETAWHNPSSLYPEAGRARIRLEDLREQLADLLGCEEPERVVFTSGATEANNAIVRNAFFRRIAAEDAVLALSPIEHPSLSAAAEYWIPEERRRLIPLDPESGAVRVEAVRELLDGDDTIGAVSVMAANNETGALQPWREIAELCRERGILYHCDAAQWLGKMPAAGLGACDFITSSAHKYGGPKGVGFLVVPEDLDRPFTSFLGGSQEHGRRGGTENLPAIAAMLAALEEKGDRWLEEESAGWSAARDRFEAAVSERLGIRPLLHGGGHADESQPGRLWNTAMLVLPRGKNVKWLTRLARRGFSLSTGSACSAGRDKPSRVMEAMGLDYDEMGRVLRVSGGWDTREDDWAALAEAFAEVAMEV